MTAVLRHLDRYRPDWQIDCQSSRGTHSAFHGLCHRVWCDEAPADEKTYDTVMPLDLRDNWQQHHDRPCTKVTLTLREMLDLPYDADLGHYVVQVSDAARHRAKLWLDGVAEQKADGKYRAVVLHYEGNSTPQLKDLAKWQAEDLVEMIRNARRQPILLDWKRQPSLSGTACPGPTSTLWAPWGCGDAELLAALIGQCEAFVGIDSGPAHVAAATTTPSLVCWLKHHPVQYFDPGGDVCHLVPTSHRSLPPADDDGVYSYFTRHYEHETYANDNHMVAVACEWLARRLGVPSATMPTQRIIIPHGLADACWSMLKVQSAAGGRPVDLVVAGTHHDEAVEPVLPLLRRLPQLSSVTLQYRPMIDRGMPTDNRGRHLWYADGRHGHDIVLNPRSVLQHGRRIEEWLPGCETNWAVLREAVQQWEWPEAGAWAGKTIKPFVAFYMGPDEANTTKGMNRGRLWDIEQWIDLSMMLKVVGGVRRKIAVVGDDSDRSYFECRMNHGQFNPCYNMIGRFDFFNQLAFLMEAEFVVAHPHGGLAVLLHLLGQRVVTWTRADGDSQEADRLVSVDERMLGAWTEPGREGDLLGCVYGRESPADIVREVERRGWLIQKETQAFPQSV